MKVDKSLNGKHRTIGDYLHLVSLPAGMLLLVTVIADVCGRVFLNKGLDFALSLEELLLMAMGFTSLAATWKGGQFIIVDVVLNRLSKRKRHVLEIGAMVISLICPFILTWFGIEAAIRDFRGGARPSNMSMPLWIWRVFVPVGCFVLMIEVLRSLIAKIRRTSSS